MKFLCPNCKAKYQISDEKIAGRTLKMDCRRCSHPIVIRGEVPADDPRSSRAGQAAARRRAGGSHVGPAPSSRSSARNALGAEFRKAAAGAPAAPARPTALDQWHVAINDVPVGPMKREEVAQKIGAGAVNGDSLVWREGFDDWRPLKSVPELAALLRKPVAPPAPARALGRAPPPAAARPVRPPQAARPQASRPAQPAASERPAARGNVVPIGGRLGAAAAPAIDDYSEVDDEPTRVGSSLDLAKLEEERLAEEARKAEEEKRREEEEEERERKERERREAEERERREAEERERAAKPTAAIVDEDAFDPFASQRAPSPVAAPQPAPVASPAFAAPPSSIEAHPRRQRAIPVGAWIAIAGAMAFGVTLAVMVGIKLFGEPAAPLAMAPTVPAPAPSDPREAVPDPEVPEAPEPAAVEEPVQEAPAEEQPQQAQQAPRERPAQGTGSSRPQQGSAAAAERATTPSTPATPRVDPEAAARLAQFADDGAEAATIDVSRRSNPLAEDRDRGDAQLSADQVRAVVNRERAAVTRCYETEARRLGQAPRMRLDVEVTIGASGTVTSAIARGQGFGNLTECIERSVRRWRFPASGGTTRTSIPFVFQGREQ